MKPPIQPIKVDQLDHNRARFQENKIVRYLLDQGPFDLNILARMDFSNEDREQFAQLIGYSLSGFAELSYVSDETLQAATLMHEKGIGETEARNYTLRETLSNLKEQLRKPIAMLYGFHPDDLK